jgi:hypothetical protein
VNTYARKGATGREPDRRHRTAFSFAPRCRFTYIYPTHRQSPRMTMGNLPEQARAGRLSHAVKAHAHLALSTALRMLGSSAEAPVCPRPKGRHAGLEQLGQFASPKPLLGEEVAIRIALQRRATSAYARGKPQFAWSEAPLANFNYAKRQARAHDQEQ